MAIFYINENLNRYNFEDLLYRLFGEKKRAKIIILFSILSKI